MIGVTLLPGIECECGCEYWLVCITDEGEPVVRCTRVDIDPSFNPFEDCCVKSCGFYRRRVMDAVLRELWRSRV